MAHAIYAPIYEDPCTQSIWTHILVFGDSILQLVKPLHTDSAILSFIVRIMSTLEECHGATYKESWNKHAGTSPMPVWRKHTGRTSTACPPRPRDRNRYKSCPQRWNEGILRHKSVHLQCWNRLNTEWALLNACFALPIMHSLIQSLTHAWFFHCTGLSQWICSNHCIKKAWKHESPHDLWSLNTCMIFEVSTAAKKMQQSLHRYECRHDFWSLNRGEEDAAITA